MNRPTRVTCLGVVLVMALSTTTLCLGQESAKDMVVTRIEHVSAADIVQMVVQIAGNEAPEMVVDQRLNRVFAKGTPESLKLMGQLIGEMDVQKPDQKQPEKQIKVFQLANAGANQVANVLSDLLSHQQLQSMRLSVDESSNSIIVSAGPDELQFLENLMVRFDQPGTSNAPAKSKPMENIVVRVTWLVDSSVLTEKTELREPVVAHEALVKGLIDSGSMGSVHSLTSSATSIQIDGSDSRRTQFTNTSMRNLYGDLHTIVAEGLVRKTSDDKFELEIDLQLVQGQVQLSVGSTILLPKNHPVAFSISDVGNFKSAAVVEVLDEN